MCFCVLLLILLIVYIAIFSSKLSFSQVSVSSVLPVNCCLYTCKMMAIVVFSFICMRERERVRERLCCMENLFFSEHGLEFAISDGFWISNKVSTRNI